MRGDVVVRRSDGKMVLVELSDVPGAERRWVPTADVDKFIASLTGGAKAAPKVPEQKSKPVQAKAPVSRAMQAEAGVTPQAPAKASGARSPRVVLADPPQPAPPVGRAPVSGVSGAGKGRRSSSSTPTKKVAPAPETPLSPPPSPSKKSRPIQVKAPVPAESPAEPEGPGAQAPQGEPEQAAPTPTPTPKVDLLTTEGLSEIGTMPEGSIVLNADADRLVRIERRQDGRVFVSTLQPDGAWIEGSGGVRTSVRVRWIPPSEAEAFRASYVGGKKTLRKGLRKGLRRPVAPSGGGKGTPTPPGASHAPAEGSVEAPQKGVKKAPGRPVVPSGGGKGTPTPPETPFAPEKALPVPVKKVVMPPEPKSLRGSYLHVKGAALPDARILSEGPAGMVLFRTNAGQLRWMTREEAIADMAGPTWSQPAPQFKECETCKGYATPKKGGCKVCGGEGRIYIGSRDVQVDGMVNLREKTAHSRKNTGMELYEGPPIGEPGVPPGVVFKQAPGHVAPGPVVGQHRGGKGVQMVTVNGRRVASTVPVELGSAAGPGVGAKGGKRAGKREGTPGSVAPTGKVRGYHKESTARPDSPTTFQTPPEPEEPRSRRNRGASVDVDRAGEMKVRRRGDDDPLRVSISERVAGRVVMPVGGLRIAPLREERA